MEAIIVLAGVAWVGLLLLPWRPWSTRERLDPPSPPVAPGLSDVTVLIPARNEAEVIGRTLEALFSQGKGLSVILVDDQSSDGTAQRAREAFPASLEVIQGKPLPDGWMGKLWALEQGRVRVQTELVLLLDADIELAPGMVHTLKEKLAGANLDLVSIMAELRMGTFWEKLLVPAFVYFFKLLYPFARANRPGSRLGAAAGGCVLVRAATLERIRAFESLRGAVIDDCALAQKVKDAGGRTWIGLSRCVRSHRPYPSLADFWNMVARSAFTQLRCCAGLLLATTALMGLVFWAPCLGLISNTPVSRLAGMVGLCAMFASYLPTLRFYRRSPLWALLLPLIASLYLLMTWTSALRCWRGRRSEWKGRVYASAAADRAQRV
jgi:hopene-associated glycosyltransferase HpnB